MLTYQLTMLIVRVNPSTNINMLKFVVCICPASGPQLLKKKKLKLEKPF